MKEKILNKEIYHSYTFTSHNTLINIEKLKKRKEILM